MSEGEKIQFIKLWARPSFSHVASPELLCQPTSKHSCQHWSHWLHENLGDLTEQSEELHTALNGKPNRVLPGES